MDALKATHAYQTRHSGELFYTHPLRVATRVLDYDATEETIITALLHDTVEDTDKTMEEVGLVFGKPVQQMIGQLTDLKTRFRKYKTTLPSETAIALCLACEPAAVLVKLCDRLHNLETIHAMPQAKKKRKAEETMAVYVLLAQKLGFTDLAARLEALCRPHLAG